MSFILYQLISHAETHCTQFIIVTYILFTVGPRSVCYSEKELLLSVSHLNYDRGIF